VARKVWREEEFVRGLERLVKAARISGRGLFAGLVLNV
jgi:hypothetical protein